MSTSALRLIGAKARCSSLLTFVHDFLLSIAYSSSVLILFGFQNQDYFLLRHALLMVYLAKRNKKHKSCERRSERLCIRADRDIFALRRARQPLL